MHPGCTPEEHATWPCRCSGTCIIWGPPSSLSGWVGRSRWSQESEPSPNVPITETWQQIAPVCSVQWLAEWIDVSLTLDRQACITQSLQALQAGLQRIVGERKWGFVLKDELDSWDPRAVGTQTCGSGGVSLTVSLTGSPLNSTRVSKMPFRGCEKNQRRCGTLACAQRTAYDVSSCML